MQGVIEAFVALFVVMDPFGVLPIFISLTKGMPKKEVRKNANSSILVAGVVLFIFLFIGLEVFDFFGINLNSFEIGGGIILLVIGVLYTLGASIKLVKPNSDLSVPVGTPLLTGPGVILTIIITVKERGTLVSVIAAILTMLATWLIIANSQRIYKILGRHWTDVISRIMGIILAAIAVGFITRGIMNIVAFV